MSAQRNKSSVGQIPTDWFVFDEMTRAGHLAMIRSVTAVSPVAVLIFAGPNRLPIEVVSEADAGVQGNRYLEETSDSEVEEKAERENTTLRIDEWTVFRSDAELAHLALQLRQKWSSLFLRRLHSPGKPMSQVRFVVFKKIMYGYSTISTAIFQVDNQVVDMLVSILSTEEHNMGLTQPVGIGQRPKPISTEALCSSPGLVESSRMMGGGGGGGNGGGGSRRGSQGLGGPYRPVVAQGGGGGGAGAAAGGAAGGARALPPQFYQRNPYR